MTRAELRALVAAVTPGEWVAYSATCCPDMGGISGPERRVCADQVGRYGHPMSLEDAELAAAARNHLGALIDQLDAAERVIEAARTTGCCMSSECAGDHGEPLAKAIADYDVIKGNL